MKFVDWGLIPYQEAVYKQMALVEAVETNQQDETIIFCSHPPVVTLGRGTKPGDVFSWQGETVEVSRGGRATYHGPNQLVIYPIIDLKKSHNGFKARDVNAFLRALEEVIVNVLKNLNLPAEVRTSKDEDGNLLTGVWINNKKVASIGVAIRKWITYHGIAINVRQDAKAFTGINPCGFKTNVMTSLEAEGAEISIDDLKSAFKKWTVFFFKTECAK